MNNSIVSEETCHRRTGEILAAVQDVHLLVERHLGEHNGCAKSEAKQTSRVRRIGVWAGVLFGSLSALSLIAAGCVKVIQWVGGP